MKRLAFAASLAALLGCSAAEAAHPAPPPVPIYREIKAWVLACDNTRFCVAKFVNDDFESSLPREAKPGYLSITRQAGPQGALVVRLETWGEEEGSPDPARLRLDGAMAPAQGWRRIPSEGAAILEGPAALDFVRSLRPRQTLAYGPVASDPQVSLSGLSAVLLAMDEAQGRLDTETALVRIGSAPASDVLAAPRPPLLIQGPTPPALAGAQAFAAAVRKSQARTLQAHDCTAEQHAADEAHALNAATVLVTLGCFFGAYQGNVLAFTAPAGHPEQAKLLVLPSPPTLDPPEPEWAGAYTEGGFDPERMTFFEAARGRGLADCGISTSWVFDGRTFHLAEFHRQERCGGPPGDWPTLFRSEVRPAS